MSTKKHTLISILFLSFMIVNVLFGSVLIDLTLDSSVSDELAVEHELEEEKEVMCFYYFVKKGIQISIEIENVSTKLYALKPSIYMVYIAIFSPPPENL